MYQKKMIMLGMISGSIAGGYMPTLMGLDSFLFSLLGSTVGALLGVWLGYKITR